MSSLSVTSQTSIPLALQVTVLRDELDSQEIEGEAVVALLDQAAEAMEQMTRELDPHLGQLLDIHI